MKSKIISMFICGLMVFSLNSVVAFANDDVQSNEVTTQEIEPRVSENEDIMLINETNEEIPVSENEEEISNIDKKIVVVENEYDDAIIYSLVSVVAILSMLGCYRTITLEKRIEILEKKEEK